jgi:hypothetical protein
MSVKALAAADKARGGSGRRAVVAKSIGHKDAQDGVAGVGHIRGGLADLAARGLGIGRPGWRGFARRAWPTSGTSDRRCGTGQDPNSGNL